MEYLEKSKSKNVSEIQALSINIARYMENEAILNEKLKRAEHNLIEEHKLGVVQISRARALEAAERELIWQNDTLKKQVQQIQEMHLKNITDFQQSFSSLKDEYEQLVSFKHLLLATKIK